MPSTSSPARVLLSLPAHCSPPDQGPWCLLLISISNNREHMRTFYKDKAPLSINPVFNMEFLDTCEEEPFYLFNRRNKNQSTTNVRESKSVSSRKSTRMEHLPTKEPLESTEMKLNTMSMSFSKSRSKYEETRVRRTVSQKRLLYDKLCKARKNDEPGELALRKKLQLRTPDDHEFQIIIRKYRAY